MKIVACRDPLLDITFVLLGLAGAHSKERNATLKDRARLACPSPRRSCLTFSSSVSPPRTFTPCVGVPVLSSAIAGTIALTRVCFYFDVMSPSTFVASRSMPKARLSPGMLLAPFTALASLVMIPTVSCFASFNDGMTPRQPGNNLATSTGLCLPTL